MTDHAFRDLFPEIDERTGVLLQRAALLGDRLPSP